MVGSNAGVVAGAAGEGLKPFFIGPMAETTGGIGSLFIGLAFILAIIGLPWKQSKAFQIIAMDMLIECLSTAIN